MKVKTDRHESSPFAATPAVPDVPARCKKTSTTALHMRLRITGRIEDAWARCAEYASGTRACEHED